MMAKLTAPFFEIGPKNYLNLSDIKELTLAAAESGSKYQVSIILTIPTPYIYPVAYLGSAVQVFAQGMDLEEPRDSMFKSTAKSLKDAGAAGVMLNHAMNPLDFESLNRAVDRSHQAGLATIVCSDSVEDAIKFASLKPDVILLEPNSLIGSSATQSRPWIRSSTEKIRSVYPNVLVMHAGGVSNPNVAEQIMAEGADGTGSTSGVVLSKNPNKEVAKFIEAVHKGWSSRG